MLDSRKLIIRAKYCSIKVGSEEWAMAHDINKHLVIKPG